MERGRWGSCRFSRMPIEGHGTRWGREEGGRGEEDNKGDPVNEPATRAKENELVVEALVVHEQEPIREVDGGT